MIVTIYPISIKIQQVVQLLYNYLQFPTISLQISYLCTNHFPKKKMEIEHITQTNSAT